MDKDTFIKALWETIYMCGWSMLFIILIGFVVGIILFNSSLSGMRPNKHIYSLTSFIVNVFRAVPFAVLIVLLIPVTKQLVGTMIGTKAVLPSLIASGIPFFARTVESTFKEVDSGLIDAGHSMGASKTQILFRIIFRESLPALVDTATLTTISIIGYTSMAGLIGGGGLGYIAIQYGIYRNNMPGALIATAMILVLVFVVQEFGNYFSKKLNRK